MAGYHPERGENVPPTVTCISVCRITGPKNSVLSDIFARFAVSDVGAGDCATQNVENIVQRE